MRTGKRARYGINTFASDSDGITTYAVVSKARGLGTADANAYCVYASVYPERVSKKS